MHLLINESAASGCLLHESVIKTEKDHIFSLSLSSLPTVHSFSKQKLVLQMQKLSSIQPHTSFPLQTIKKAAISLKKLQWKRIHWKKDRHIFVNYFLKLRECQNPRGILGIPKFKCRLPYIEKRKIWEPD